MTRMVFIVDSEPGSREALSRFCELNGCRARAFGRGVELLLALGETRPCLMLIDTALPDIDGVSLCRAINTQPATRALPVLLMSRRARPEDVDLASDAGACGFLAKPFELGALRAVLARLAPPDSEDADDMDFEVVVDATAMMAG